MRQSKHDGNLFFWIAGVLAGFLMFLLQENGVLAISWFLSALLYFLILVVFLWAYHNWSEPQNWGVKVRVLVPVVVAFALGTFASLGVRSAYRREHPSPVSAAISTQPKRSEGDQAQSSSGVAQTHSESAPKNARAFLPPDIDGEYLTGLYRNHTSLQADALAASYIGKWMRLSVVVNDVKRTENGLYSISYMTDKFIVDMRFTADWADRASMLRAGSRVKVVGKLSAIDNRVVMLDHGELE